MNLSAGNRFILPNSANRDGPVPSVQPKNVIIANFDNLKTWSRKIGVSDESNSEKSCSSNIGFHCLMPSLFRNRAS